MGPREEENVESYEMGVDASSGTSWALSSFKSRVVTDRTLLHVAYAVQVVPAIVILVLSILLNLRWTTIQKACGGAPYDDYCSSVVNGLGGVQFCVSVGALAIANVLLGAVDFWVRPLPWCVLYGCCNITGGFALGGGCTLAAMINNSGWSVPVLSRAFMLGLMYPGVAFAAKQPRMQARVSRKLQSPVPERFENELSSADFERSHGLEIARVVIMTKEEAGNQIVYIPKGKGVNDASQRLQYFKTGH